MISDDIIQNAVLYRANTNTTNSSKKKPVPFLVPIKDSISERLNDKKIVVKVSSQKTDAIKRANHDALMAAAIGDLNWLKQTLKISSDIILDPNGFTTLHLASIHGRINILKFLLEEKQFDPNFPSKYGWRPVHLCISNKIGSKAAECLIYLVGKGADINVKNDDNIFPLHMAASEGQLECLKILLNLRADITVTDKRGQTPLDLARLWGHRKCAKMLQSIMWHKTKNELYEEEKLQMKNHVQEILKDVEKAHQSFYENEPENVKQNFDIWLENQGFPSSAKISKSQNNSNITQVDLSKSSTNSITKSIDSKNKNKSKPTQLSIPIKDLTKDGDESSMNYYYKPEVSLLTKSQPNLNSTKIDESENKKNIRQIKSCVNKNKKSNKMKTNLDTKSNLAWNFSTKKSNSDYVTNLKDFFPRDPYTFLPKNLNLVLLDKELRGMTMEEVKDFMKKRLEKPHLNINHDPFSNQPTSNVVYKPKNIIDVPAKAKLPKEDRLVEEAGFNLCNDKTAFPFKEATKFIERSQKIDKIKFDLAHDNDSQIKKNGISLNSQKSIDLAKKQYKLQNVVNDEKLERIRKNFGNELSEFMKDSRHGNLSQKYEKVFII